MFEPVSETKVCNYNVSMAVEEKVFEFEVAMHDFLLVDVPDARDQLREQLCGILLLEVAMSQYVVEQLSTGSIFQDDANVLVGFDNIIETDDVRVFEGPKNLDLTLHLGHPYGGIDVSSPDKLHSNLFAPLVVETQFDLSELALAECL